MKEWRVLVGLEYEWRIFRFHRRIMNFLIQRGVHLTSPVMCLLSKTLDRHSILISELKHLYENNTGKTVVFYY